MTILYFCQNDSLMGGSLWQKDRMVTHILFDLYLLPSRKFWWSVSNKKWFEPWFNILLHTQSIVCATVDSQCLEYLGYITLGRPKSTFTIYQDVMLTQLFQHYEMGWYFFFEGAFLFPFHATDKLKRFPLSSIMAIPVVEFLRWGSKLERFLNQL